MRIFAFLQDFGVLRKRLNSPKPLQIKDLPFPSSNLTRRLTKLLVSAIFKIMRLKVLFSIRGSEGTLNKVEFMGNRWVGLVVSGLTKG